jgi:hypothetical protein
VVQEAVARFVVGEGEDVVHGPGRSGARSEVEFYVVFVLVEPGIEQEGGLSCMRAPRRNSLILLWILRVGARMIFFSLRAMGIQS